MRKAAGPKGRTGAVKRAREQRRAMSLPELALWSVLRTRPDDIKFRRQHPLGDDLSLDFYCNDERLCIEADGAAHGMGDRPIRDGRRDAFLAAHGICTLRVPAVDVMRNREGVLLHILATVRERLPLHHRPKGAGGPPPRGELGEDED